MKIAIPIYAKGFEGPICEHFGHCEKFAIVDYDETLKKVKKIDEIENIPHQEGGCMQPVMLLKHMGVNSIIIIGMGQRPLMGFLQQGINVIRGVSASAKENLELYLAGKLQLTTSSTCNH